MFAGNLEKDKKIKPTLLIPREFDIKPSSHPRGENLPLLHTLHLEAQPILYIYYFPFRVSRVLVGEAEGDFNYPQSRGFSGAVAAERTKDT